MKRLIQSVLFRRILVTMLFVIFCIGCIAVGFSLFFPKEELKARLIQELTKQGAPLSQYQLTIGELDVSLFRPGLQLQQVALKKRSLPVPEGAAAKPGDQGLFVLDSVAVFIPRWDMIRGVYSPSELSVEADLYEGTLLVRYEKPADNKPAQIRIEGRQLQLASFLKQLGTPIATGKVSIDGTLSLANLGTSPTATPAASRIQGNLQLKIEGLEVGNRSFKIPAEKLAVPGASFATTLQSLAPDGLVIPPASLGRVEAKLVLTDQRELKIEKWTAVRTESSKPVVMTSVSGQILLGPQPSMQLTVQMQSIRDWLDLFVKQLKQSLADKGDKGTASDQIFDFLSKKVLEAVERPDQTVRIQLSGPLSKPIPTIKKND